MKKFMKTMFVFIVILLFAHSAFAAVGTVTGAATVVKKIAGQPAVVKVVLTCTGGTAGEAGTYPATVINTLSGVSSTTLLGLNLHYIQVYPGGTAPVDASDMTITMDGVDILGGRGTDLIDNTSLTSCAPGTVGAVGDIPITGNITLNISGNTTASAVVTIILTFIN